jgi:hypothetical protein
MPLGRLSVLTINSMEMSRGLETLNMPDVTCPHVAVVMQFPQKALFNLVAFDNYDGLINPL